MSEGKQNLAPVALFVYNRPYHTLKTIDRLKKNTLAKETDLFIFADAAKTQKDISAVKEVADIISATEGFKTIKIITQEHNLGLAQSIINGVSELVKKYGKVIVFEDDLLSSPYTLSYFNDALNFYQTTPKVMHISAYMFPLAGADELPETFLYRAVHSWGWATWERAWNNFDPDIDHLMAQFNQEKIHAFSIEGKMNFWKQMKDFKAGKNNSWAIRWYASVFLKQGLSLNPAKSLIHNIGHDGTGIHSNVESTFDVQIHQHQLKEFPTIIEENTKAYRMVKEFLAKRKGNLLQRVARLIKKKLN